MFPDAPSTAQLRGKVEATARLIFLGGKKSQDDPLRLVPVMWFGSHEVRDADKRHYLLREGHVVHEPALKFLMEALDTQPHPIQYTQGHERWGVAPYLATPFEDPIETCAPNPCASCPMLPICGLGGVPFGGVGRVRAHNFHFRKAVLEATVEPIPRLTVYGVDEPVIVHSPRAFDFFPQFRKPGEHPFPEF